MQQRTSHCQHPQYSLSPCRCVSAQHKRNADDFHKYGKNSRVLRKRGKRPRKSSFQKKNHLNPFLLQQTDHITLDSPWASVIKMMFQTQVSCKLCQNPEYTLTPTFINLTVFQNQFSDPCSTHTHISNLENPVPTPPPKKKKITSYE